MPGGLHDAVSQEEHIKAIPLVRSLHLCYLQAIMGACDPTCQSHSGNASRALLLTEGG